MPGFSPAAGKPVRAAGRGAAKLERLIQVETARSLLTDTGVPMPPADSPNVQEAADKIDADCESSEPREYDCEIGVGDSVQHCEIGTNTSITRILWSRCGADHPPEVEDEYVDCESIGQVVAADDPTGDVTDNAHPADGVISGPDAAVADLKRLRVAVGSEQICVEAEVGAPIEPPYSLNFWARPLDGSGDQLHLAGSIEDGQPPRVGNTTYGALDGRLGVSGSSLSMVVERGDLPAPLSGAIDGPFSILAQVGHRIDGTPPQPYSHIDQLDAAGGQVVYP